MSERDDKGRTTDSKPTPFWVENTRESLDNQKAQTTQGLLHIWLIAAHADNCLVAHKIGTFCGHWFEKQETSTANNLESPPPPPQTPQNWESEY